MNTISFGKGAEKTSVTNVVNEYINLTASSQIDTFISLGVIMTVECFDSHFENTSYSHFCKKYVTHIPSAEKISISRIDTLETLIQ